MMIADKKPLSKRLSGEKIVFLKGGKIKPQ